MARTPQSQAVTAANIKQCFASTRLPVDPTDVIELPGSRHWPSSLRERLNSTLTPAGVLIPVIERSRDDLTVLLTQRSAELKHHAGQISFPGGRMESSDPDIAQTALRETHEEVGIPGDQVQVVGNLPPMPTISGYAVTPVVGLLGADTEAVADRTEVEFAFEVPLSFLLDPANRRVVERELHGKRLPMVEFHYAEHRIWGATAMMIISFINVINNNDL